MVFFRHRTRERHLRYRVATAEREIQQINREAAEARAQLEERARLQREAARIRAARRAFMEKLKRRKEEDERRGARWGRGKSQVQKEERSVATHTTLVVVDAYNAEEAVQMRRFARGRLQPLASWPRILIRGRGKSHSIRCRPQRTQFRSGDYRTRRPIFES